MVKRAALNACNSKKKLRLSMQHNYFFKHARKPKCHKAKLALRVGTTKSYISKIENGVVEPGVGLFFRLINALGLRIDITNPIGM